MGIWHTKVEIDGDEVVLALGAPSAEAAAGRVTTDHAAGSDQRYATAEGHHVDVRWSRARAVNVNTVLPASEHSRHPGGRAATGPQPGVTGGGNRPGEG